jgi:purine-binding chemotaxis protein CheW
MSPGAAEVMSDRLRELRDGFDRSFAEPPRRHDGEHDELLAIRAGHRRYVLRLSQTAGLYSDRPITALPGPLTALLGIAGFSGAIVPVYDLGALLGHPVPEPPRWLVIAAGAPAVAVAFHDLDGHLRTSSESIIGESDRLGQQGCLRGMVSLPDGTRAIVDMPSVRAAVHALTGHATAHGE